MWVLRAGVPCGAERGPSADTLPALGLVAVLCLPGALEQELRAWSRCPGEAQPGSGVWGLLQSGATAQAGPGWSSPSHRAPCAHASRWSRGPRPGSTCRPSCSWQPRERVWEPPSCWLLWDLPRCGLRTAAPPFLPRREQGPPPPLHAVRLGWAPRALCFAALILMPLPLVQCGVCLLSGRLRGLPERGSATVGGSPGLLCWPQLLLLRAGCPAMPFPRRNPARTWSKPCCGSRPGSPCPWDALSSAPTPTFALYFEHPWGLWETGWWPKGPLALCIPWWAQHSAPCLRVWP